MLEAIRNVLWSLPTVGLLTGTGIYFTVKSKFYPLTHLKDIIKSPFCQKGNKEISPFKALMTSLGGTVGVGSITGVAYALQEGGKGALFWMWVSSFFCMMLKYAENYITVKETASCSRGASGAVILKSLGKRKTAAFFAIAGILASFGGGNAAQTKAFALSANAVGIKEVTAGIVFVLLLIPVILGGQKGIAKVNGILVPIAGCVFLSAVAGIICFNIKNLPFEINETVKSAFGIRQAGAGFTGSMLSLALRTGVSKGVFSHEAGMGSSPIAHACSDTTPERAGNFGIIEIFADTFTVSTLTALALILTGSNTAEQLFYSAFGSTGLVFLCVAVGIFSYAAVISWCFYSESFLYFLFPLQKVPFYIYRMLVLVFAFSGCVSSSGGVFECADIFNALMLFPNLYAIIIKRKEIYFGNSFSYKTAGGAKAGGKYINRINICTGKPTNTKIR